MKARQFRTPSVSVGLPVFNGDDYLADAGHPSWGMHR